MKCIVSTACVLSVLVAVSFAAPYFPAQFSASSNLQVSITQRISTHFHVCLSTSHAINDLREIFQPSVSIAFKCDYSL